MKIKYPNMDDIQNIIDYKTQNNVGSDSPVFTLGELLNSMATTIIVPDQNSHIQRVSTYNPNTLPYSTLSSESHFFMQAGQVINTNTIQIVQSTNCSASVYNRNIDPYMYTPDEVLSLSGILIQLFQRLMDLPSRNNEPCYLQTTIDPFSILINGIQSQLLTNNYNDRYTTRMHRYFNNLLNDKIGCEVNPLFLSQEVREGAPFSIKKSIEKALQTDELTIIGSYGISLDCTWHNLFDLLATLASKNNNSSSELYVEPKLLSRFQKDIENHMAALYFSPIANLFLSKRELNQYTKHSPTASKMKKNTYGIINSNWDHLTYYQLTHIENINSLSMKDFLQPATIEEALEELEKHPPVLYNNELLHNVIQLTTHNTSPYNVLYEKLQDQQD